MELIINTLGTSITVENGLFVIKNRETNKSIPVSKLSSIVLSKGARISSDAVLLAIDHEIQILFVDGLGKPQGRIWSVKYGSISTLRKKQLSFTASKEAVNWVKSVVVQKIENQQALLFSLVKADDQADNLARSAIAKMDDYISKIKHSLADNVTEIAPSLRGWEGAASRLYFDCLPEFVLPQYRFKGRSQRGATDVFNMLLNYGYGMLYGKIEGALIKAGLDPYMGVMHRDDYNRPVLAYDCIELFRVWVDFVVVALCAQPAIDSDCFSVRDGVFWLEAMGKRILIQSVNDYLDELITLRGLVRSRKTHIDLWASELAAMISKL